MVGKAPGLVLCAHCGERDSASDCPACARMVCERCAADWRTCPVPHARAVELGRLDFVGLEPTGRWALATREPMLIQRVFGARRRLYFVNLATGARTPPDGLRWNPVGEPHLDRDGTARWVEVDYTQAQVTFFCTARPGETEAERVHDPTPPTGRIARDDQTRWWIADNLLHLTDMRGDRRRRLAGLPQRLAIHAVDYDPASRLLAVGTWERLYLFHAADKITHASTAELPPDDVHAVMVKAGRVMAVTALGRALHGFDHDERGRLSERRFTEKLGGRRLFDLSDAGDQLAIGWGKEVRVVPWGGGEGRSYRGHRGNVARLTFTDGAEQLVSIDSRGTVILRPRTERGYAELPTQ